MDGWPAIVSASSPTGNTFAKGSNVALYKAPDTGPTQTLHDNTTTFVGEGTPHDNMQPSLGLRYILCVQGEYPTRDNDAPADDGVEYIGDVKAFAFGHTPKNWSPCEGQILRKEDNKTLFELLDYRYGGDGSQTFALPELRGRAAVGVGKLEEQDTGLGDMIGDEAVALEPEHLPKHNHLMERVSGQLSDASPAGNMVCANETYKGPLTDGTPDVTLAPGALAAPDPSGETHDNMMPFLAVNYCICVAGTVPSASGHAEAGQ